jgi:hypothetical protein
VRAHQGLDTLRTEATLAPANVRQYRPSATNVSAVEDALLISLSIWLSLEWRFLDLARDTRL